MCSIGFGDEQQTRRVFVEPMNQTFATRTGAFCERTATTFQRVDEGPAPMAGRRMHHHAGWLVNDKHIVIFKYNIELNHFR